MMKSQGVLSEDGTKIYQWGMMNCLETLTWQSTSDIVRLTINHHDIKISVLLLVNILSEIRGLYYREPRPGEAES